MPGPLACLVDKVRWVSQRQLFIFSNASLHALWLGCIQTTVCKTLKSHFFLLLHESNHSFPSSEVL